MSKANKAPRGVAVIGCGDMGSKHAKTWHNRGDAKVLAVYDPITERAQKAADETGAKVCGSHEEAILTDGVEVVSVATPVVFHSPIACFAADHGKHVISEKPVALTLPQAEAMKAAAERNNVQMAVSYQYRSFPRCQKLREMIRGGEFGGPVFARMIDVREVRPKIAMHQKGMNGGPLIDMAGHYFDLMRFLTGEEPESVYATGHIFGKNKPRLAEVKDFAIDAASVEVRYSGCVSLSVFACWGMPEGLPGRGDEYIVGPEITAQNRGSGLEIQRGGGVKEEWKPDHPGIGGGPESRIADLVHALDTGEPLEVSVNEGIVALRVALAALESIETGKIVTL